MTLGWLKQKFPSLQTEGIEIAPDAACQARQHVDVVHCLDFERQSAPDSLGRFDLILCLDVLEHLVDPWLAVERLVTDHLVEGGSLIVSLPNVRHHSVLWPLLVRGRWNYTDDGLLDRTHLRFFTKQSALSLAMNVGKVELIRSTGLEAGRKTRWVNWMTLSLFRPFLEFQYLIRVRKVVV
jgi:2-polyprenyl-3-methyl-5-hydroxy-6-metoxy-1,4-benzoquinol methylase